MDVRLSRKRDTQILDVCSGPLPCKQGEFPPHSARTEPALSLKVLQKGQGGGSGFTVSVGGGMQTEISAAAKQTYQCDRPDSPARTMQL